MKLTNISLSFFSRWRLQQLSVLSHGFKYNQHYLKGYLHHKPRAYTGLDTNPMPTPFCLASVFFFPLDQRDNISFRLSAILASYCQYSCNVRHTAVLLGRTSDAINAATIVYFILFYFIFVRTDASQ